MPRCQYVIKAIKPPIRTITNRPYPHSPQTLGDFLRKKRLDLGLTQKQVADLLKTFTDNIRNWEVNRRVVSLQFKQKVYNFVGFCPCDVSLPIGLKLKERREYFGLTIKKLSNILGIDSCTIAYWERGEHLPSERSIKIIEGFLTLFLLDIDAMPELEILIQSNLLSGSNFSHYIAYESHWSMGQKITT